MGVPFLRRWLKRKVVNAVYGGKLQKVHSLAVDANALLHTCVRNVLDRRKSYDDEDQKVELEVIDTFLYALATLFQKYKPTDTFYVALDGPAPVAKMVQQRWRRYISSSSQVPSFSGKISAGTSFMVELDSKLHTFLLGKGVTSNFSCKQVIYSSWRVPGEGEHKIMDYYRSLTQQQRDKQHVIYSPDADLSILGAANNVNLFIVNDNPDEAPISCTAFRTYIQTQIPLSGFALEDFVLIATILGNDFLPRQVSFLSLEACLPVLLTSYSDFLKERQDGGQKPGLVFYDDSGNLTADFEALMAFVSYLADREQDMLVAAVKSKWEMEEEYEKKARTFEPYVWPPPVLNTSSGEPSEENYSIDEEAFRVQWRYQFAPLHTSGTLLENGEEVIVGQLLEDIEGVSEVLESYVNTDCKEETLSAVNSYLTGMVWVLHYYMGGDRAVNREWYYPHHYAPLLSDIASLYAERKVSEPLLHRPCFQNLESITVLHQLVSTMPTKYKSYLPSSLSEILPLFDSNSPIADLFPTGFQTYSNGEVDHAKGALIPFPDILRVEVCLRAMVSVQTLISWSNKDRESKPGSNEEYVYKREGPELADLFAPAPRKTRFEANAYPTRKDETMQVTVKTSGAAPNPLPPRGRPDKKREVIADYPPYTERQSLASLTVPKVDASVLADVTPVYPTEKRREKEEELPRPTPKTAPKTAPKTDAPKTDAPKTDAPKTAPKAAPKTAPKPTWVPKKNT